MKDRFAKAVECRVTVVAFYVNHILTINVTISQFLLKRISVISNWLVSVISHNAPHIVQ